MRTNSNPARVAGLALGVLLAACVGPRSTPELSTPRTMTPPPATTAPPAVPSPTTATTSPSIGPSPAVPSPAPSIGGPRNDVRVHVELMASGLSPLVFLAHAGDGSGVLYAVAQRGLVTPLSASGEVQAEPFLDIGARLSSGGERGLLGLAFHPDYASNGRFFVNYTDRRGDTVISEFARRDGDDAVLADADSERVLLTIDQPYPNHNGGMIAFGPDGYLYIATGDGGGGGDPDENGQSMTSLLGKILRIDVDDGEPYGIPPDNPFIGRGAPEIWDLGLRNPWRFSFDRATGDLFIGDVGQNAVEEIDAEPAGQGGRNYGWNIMEGDRCYPVSPCDETGLTLPVSVNDRSRGECAIVGGYVYRGRQFPGLQGTYLFSDNCSPTLWALDAQTAIATGSADAVDAGTAGTPPSSFGEDEQGELYLVNLRGEIYRLNASTP